LPAGYAIQLAGEIEAAGETFGGTRLSLILAGLFVTAILILLRNTEALLRTAMIIEKIAGVLEVPSDGK
jgi:hypothetical protein